jgi:CheY-like chemotaxis protein
MSGRGQTVLVVDDEPFILATARAALQAADYRVFCAHDGAEALVLFQENRDAVRVVLLDMMMPDMDGPTTLRELHRLAPDLPIVVASGLGGKERVAEVIEAGARAFLPKPFTEEQLVEVLENVLGGT